MCEIYEDLYKIGGGLVIWLQGNLQKRLAVERRILKKIMVFTFTEEEFALYAGKTLTGKIHPPPFLLVIVSGLIIEFTESLWFLVFIV